MEESQSRKEGWTWISNSSKWHYFRDARSLCGKFACFAQEFGEDKFNSPDNCKQCEKKRLKENTTTKEGEQG